MCFDPLILTYIINDIQYIKNISAAIAGKGLKYISDEQTKYFEPHGEYMIFNAKKCVYVLFSLYSLFTLHALLQIKDGKRF